MPTPSSEDMMLWLSSPWKKMIREEDPSPALGREDT